MFAETREFVWEGDEALLIQNGIPDPEVEVLCAYKPGFFWLLEHVLPAFKANILHHLTIRVAEEREDFTLLKSFYSEPTPWLQELYPIDEVLAKELHLPLDRITFELSHPGEPVYEALGFDDSGILLGRHSFSPRTRNALYLSPLPEWGKVKRTTGWLQITSGEKTVFETLIQTDLERFWNFYQDEVLKNLYAHILNKTGHKPTFNDQPYFKRLLVEMHFSEPDDRLGLDEEMISSLKAIHDELYFDTLDFLRGISDIQVEEDNIPEDTSRYSAPGNILPLVHPSLEGQGAKVKVALEEPAAKSSKMVLKWKERDRPEIDRTILFPTVKPKGIRLTALTYNGQDERVENVLAEIEIDQEKDYLFRDYCIPRGWFAYINSVTLPVYRPWTQAAEDLKSFIIREINAEARIKEANAKFYDRYDRWAVRWQPHLDYLEIEEGVNLYARRRSSRETRLTPRRRMTFVEETPEMMDETARGSWLEFLCAQGLAYVRAHLKYLAQVQHETVRIEEESGDRVHIQFVRGCPGRLEH